MEFEVVESVDDRTPSILVDLVHQLNYKVASYEAQLQTEESGNNIAKLQGQCAGYRSYLQSLHEVGYRDFRGDKEELRPWSDDEMFKFPEMSKIVPLIREWQSSNTYSLLMKNLEAKVDDKKNDLYYEAEKGRDLFFTKGWHNAVQQISDWCSSIIDSYEQEKKRIEKEKSESLFGEE
jgi:hypothetical protein